MLLKRYDSSSEPIHYSEKDLQIMHAFHIIKCLFECKCNEEYWCKFDFH